MVAAWGAVDLVVVVTVVVDLVEAVTGAVVKVVVETAVVAMAVVTMVGGEQVAVMVVVVVVVVAMVVVVMVVVDLVVEATVGVMGAEGLVIHQKLLCTVTEEFRILQCQQINYLGHNSMYLLYKTYVRLLFLFLQDSELKLLE